MPGSFFDTNVLLYVASANPGKADRAEELIGAGGTISVQGTERDRQCRPSQDGHVMDRNPRF
jgi:hypothetical protein